MKRLIYIKQIASKRKMLLLAGVVVMFGMALITIFLPEQAENNMGLFVRQFAPDTLVSYEIFFDKDLIGRGSGKTDQTGNAQFPMPVVDTQNAPETLTYRLSARPSGDNINDKPLNLELKLNRRTGKMAFSGSGVEDFSDISFSRNDKALNTKADWAGFFAETDLNPPPLKSDQENVKIAFQSYNFATDAIPSKSAIVEVLIRIVDDYTYEDVQPNYTRALALMTEQLTVIMMKQMEIVGTFFDASIQLEVQRKQQELRAQAHKDYHPSEQICVVGSAIRGVAASESHSKYAKAGLNKFLINQYLGVKGSATIQGPASDIPGHMEQFAKDFCDPKDNNNGLKDVCTGPRSDRLNKDIDYARTVDYNLTLDTDFSDNSLSDDEEDILALSRNLYFADSFDEGSSKGISEDPRSHYATRSLAAKLNVAHNTLANIVGMKSKSDAALFGGNFYMKDFMKSLGFSSAEVDDYLGDNPSYYAKMEVLTKKIFQDPHFFTNLYDKPANVDRIGVSLDAISLINQRDRYEGMLRREVLTSLLLEDALQDDVEKATSRVFEAMQEPQR